MKFRLFLLFFVVGFTASSLQEASASIPEGATVNYYHVDSLGSVVGKTDEGGDILARRRYEPYGRDLDGNLDGPSFTGHVGDSETDLMYMQQRYYDPAIAMFLSVDPLTAFESPVRNFNQYRYAESNPYKYVDPDGRFAQLVWGAVAGAGVDIAAQQIANPGGRIELKSVLIAAGVGAVSGGVSAVARVAAIKGTVTIKQAVAITAGANATAGAAGSAVSSISNGESPSLAKMGLAAATNGANSVAASLKIEGKIAVQKMSSAKPSSPQGIGNHIIDTTSGISGQSLTSAAQGGASASGAAVQLIGEAGANGAQKKIEENLK
ncbi:RHS repeat-associated core domain-containing protein [Pseudomonas aeruginosa]|nr:RHS repeat-associated core domain-containing protein [Pseudomonas aeruginosa]